MSGVDSSGKGDGGIFASSEDIFSTKKGMTNADFINARKRDPLLVIGLFALLLGIELLLLERFEVVSSLGVLLRLLEALFNVSIQQADVETAISRAAWVLGAAGVVFLVASIYRTRCMPPALETKRRVLRILCNECKSYFKFGEKYEPRALKVCVRPVKGYALIKCPYMCSSELLKVLCPHIKSLGCVEAIDCADKKMEYIALLFKESAKSKIMDGHDWRVR